MLVMNMILSIKNDYISLSVDTHGAQMMNIQSADGVEYLWQGNPAYWKNRAPVLFPFIGRSTNNSYCYHGQVYPIDRHGFAPTSEFDVLRLDKDAVLLELKSNDQTKKQYPFAFSFKIRYALVKNNIQITYTVENLDDKTLSFGIGGHPGFNVPLVPGESFEDYKLIFGHPCKPDRIGFTEDVYLSGRDVLYPLENDVSLDLCHDLFDNDAIIFKNMDREVTLLSKKSGRGVRLAYPDMQYLGIWHMPKTDAPYVCVEPWSSLPSRQDIVEEISCKSDMIHLTAGRTYETIWSITVL